jgi:hypothetical protein
MAVTWITAADLSDPSNPLAPEAAESASWILYKLSGEKYAGVRTAIDWYGVPDARCGPCAGLITADYYAAFDHQHLFISPSLLDDRSSSRLRLRGRPASSIGSVVGADGVTVDPASYRLVNSAYLVRLGSDCWDLTSGVTVTYTYGVMPPAAGKFAAIKLADELVKLVTDPGACSLPERVSSVSRQGVSYTILDPQTFLTDGRTGVYEIDLFLKAANPNGAKKRPRVFSPDIPRGER